MDELVDIEPEALLSRPSEIEGPTDPLEWTEATLLNRALYYFAATQVESRDEQKIVYAKKFYEQTRKLYEDKLADPGFKTRKLAKFALNMGLKLTDVSQNVQRVNNHLFLNSDGTYTGSEQSADLGNEALNQLMICITRVGDELREFKNEIRQEIKQEVGGLRQEMKQEVGGLKQEVGGLKQEVGGLKQEMGEVKCRLENLEKRALNFDLRFENQFKGRGGYRVSLDAYHSIYNSENQLPTDVGLAPLTSLAQIEQLSRGIDSYLTFYKLLTSGLLEDKRERLIRYIGVNVESERSYGRKI